MGSGLLRELHLLKKFGSGGVYVTDPAVATFSGPKLTVWIQECATVEKLVEKMLSYKRQMQIAR